MTVRNLSSGGERRVLPALVLSAVVIWIDTTVLGIALEHLADPRRGLGASPGQLQWAVGSYALLFATALFAAGALGDRYGQRTVLLAGLVTFGVASVAAAWAGNPTELIVARGAMGVGGAMIMPTSMAIIGASFPPERRAGAIAAWTASSGVGVALGPLVGGLLLDRFWWGSVFLVNPPIVALAMAGIVRYAPNPRGARRSRPDLTGLVLSTAGLATLAYGLIEAGQQTDWGRVQVWLPVIAGLLVLALFVVAEARTAQPSFDPRLFRVGRFAAGNLALGALFFAITGQMFYGNFYLQGARALSAVQSGLAFLPGALGVVVGSGVGPRLVRRFGVGRVSGGALFLAAAGFVANLSIGTGTPLLWFCTLGALNGIAIGATIAPTAAAVIAVLPVERMGAGSAVNNAVRQVGSVLGIAVLGTVLTVGYRDRIRPAVAGLPPQARGIAQTSAEHARALARVLHRPELTSAANRAFVQAMHLTAVSAGGVLVTGAILLALTFRDRRPAGIPAVRQDARLGERRTSPLGVGTGE